MAAADCPVLWPRYRDGGTVVPIFFHSGDHDPLAITFHLAPLFQQLLEHQPQQVELRIVDGGHEWSVWRSALAAALPYLLRHAASDAAAPAATSAPAAKADAGCQSGVVRVERRAADH